MGSNAVAQDIVIKAVGLVRNKDQQPQFDDWDHIPEKFHQHLSVEDWEYIEQQRKA